MPIIVQTQLTLSTKRLLFAPLAKSASLLYAHVEGEEHIGAVMMGHKLPGFYLVRPFPPP